MRYCANCGEPLTDDAVFCPECGEPVEKREAVQAPAAAANAASAAPAAAEAPAPAKKKSKVGKRIAIIAAIVLAVLIAAAAVLYFTGLYKDILPHSRLKLGLAEKALVDEGLDKAFEEHDEIKEIKADMTGSVSLETNGELGMFSEIGIIKMLLEQIDFDINVEASPEHSGLYAGLTYSGTPLLNGRLVVEDDKIGIYLPQLDDNYYVMTGEAFSSLLGEDSEAPKLGEIDLTAFDETATRREVMDILNIISGLSTPQNTRIEGNSSASLYGGEKTVPAAEYVITPGEEEIKSVLNRLADYLGREDSYLGKRLGSLYKACVGVFSDDPESVPASIPEALRKAAEEHAANIVEENTHIVVYMVGNTIISQRIVTDQGSFGYDNEKAEASEHTYLLYDGSDEEYTSVDLVRYTSDPDNLKGSIKVDSEVFGDVTVYYDLDKTVRSALGTYPGRVDISSDGFIVNIKVENDEDMTHTIKISPTDLDEYDEIRSITLTLAVSEGEGVKAPDVAPTDISDKTPEEIGEIFDNMLDQLYGALLGTLIPGSAF